MKELRSIEEIITDLKKPIPQEYLERRVQSGVTLTYWPWYVGVRAFDKYGPGWGYTVDDVQIVEGHVLVVCSVYLPCQESPTPGVRRSGTGGDYENLDEVKRMKGFDPLLDAERQAMKRAMSSFGFGLGLYER